MTNYVKVAKEHGVVYALAKEAYDSISIAGSKLAKGISYVASGIIRGMCSVGSSINRSLFGRACQINTKKEEDAINKAANTIKKAVRGFVGRNKAAKATIIQAKAKSMANAPSQLAALHTSDEDRLKNKIGKIQKEIDTLEGKITDLVNSYKGQFDHHGNTTKDCHPNAIQNGAVPVAKMRERINTLQPRVNALREAFVKQKEDLAKLKEAPKAE